ncbi:MAG: hypothetical protein JW909_07340 [Planctomycetes bacterium]|nr:hypothetical protein [Planctomycetota bacterium]
MNKTAVALTLSILGALVLRVLFFVGVGAGFYLFQQNAREQHRRDEPKPAPVTPDYWSDRPEPAPVAPPEPVVSHRVALKTRISSWRWEGLDENTPDDEKPSVFDIEGVIREQMLKAGVGVAAEGDPVSATVLVEFSESKGDGYGFTPYSVDFYGTDMHCNVRILDGNMDEIIEFNMYGSPPHTVESGGVYAAAARSLKACPEFDRLGDFIAAVAGNHAAAAGLVPLLADHGLSENVASILDSIDYSLDAPRDQAYLAVAVGSFEECSALGEPAVEALDAAVSHHDCAGSWEQHSSIAGTLAAIGGARAREALRRQLVRLVDVEVLYTAANTPDDDGFVNEDFDIGDREDFLEALVSVIRAQADAGDQFDLDLLSRLAASQDASIAAAAAAAYNALWQKVGPSPQSLPAAQKGRLKIILKTGETSWSNDSPFDITANFKKCLEDIHVQVVPDGSPADGVVLLDYQERRAGDRTVEFGLAPLISTTYYIPCTIAVLDPRRRNTCRVAAAYNGIMDVNTRRNVFAGDLRSLREAGILQDAALAVAAALGSPAALEECVPRLADNGIRSSWLQLFNAHSFQPQKPENKAYLAAARGNFEECLPLGSAAVKPMAAYLKSATAGGLDLAQVDLVCGTAAVLERSGGPAARSAVLNALERFECREKPAEDEEDYYYYEEDGNEERLEKEALAAAALLKALGALGDEFSIKHVSRFLDDRRDAVSTAAAEALSRLKTRLKQED